ncbi:MAG: caspase family protein [Prochlorotrichaceae cyanobacterium]
MFHLSKQRLRHLPSLLSVFLILLEMGFIPGWMSRLLAQTDSDRGVQRLEIQRSENALQSDRRIALVLGNSQYEVAPLSNPRNDASDIGEVLKRLGFDRVIVQLDADLAEMENALEQFYQELQRGGVGVFYYAGHGVQSNGENYLIPVDATIELEADLTYDALPLGKVLNRMDAAQNKLNIVILDACRNNPFARSWRSQTRGLASVNAPGGTFIAYATSPGDVASDGRGRNSPFTEAILRHIDQPIPIQTLFMNVRVDVLAATNNRQTPWDASSLTEEFRFSQPADPSPLAPSEVSTAATTPLPNVSPTPVPSSSTPSEPLEQLEQLEQPNISPSRLGKTLQFESIPRLTYSGTTRDRVGARGATYYFTFEFPASEGAGLETLLVEQTSGESVALRTADLEVFQGTRRDRGEAITFSLESAPSVPVPGQTNAVRLRFNPPISPGQTFTVSVPPRSNPAQSGAILYTFTAFPPGQRERGIPLGIGEISFFDSSPL